MNANINSALDAWDAKINQNFVTKTKENEKKKCKEKTKNDKEKNQMN